MYIQLLKKIYDLLIDNVPLTKENLNQASITDEQINELIENGLIYANKFGTYSITSVNKLYLYGKQNLLAGNKRTAQECFVLCYRLKPKHRETCLQMFYHAVLTHRYDEAYEYLYALENVSTNEHLRKEYKIYLYLLSLVSEVPENYQEKLEAIHNDQSLLIHKKPKPFQKEDNIVMELILKGKYKFAIENLNNFLAEDFDYMIHRLIIKNLLCKIIDIDSKQKKELLELVKKRHYREIVTMLEELSLLQDLKIDEANILEVTKIIIGLFETGDIPETIENNAETLTEAISNHDYEKALDIETKFLITKGMSLSESAIYALLTELNQLSRNIKRLKDNNISINNSSTMKN
jgi:hypothetical protein